MALRFRNLTVGPDDPVTDWGVEGILTALERGGLAEWRRIARALDRDASGRLAAEIAQAVEIADAPGAVALFRDLLARRAAGDDGEIARRVRRAQRRSGLTASAFAERVGTSPSRLSTYRTGRVVPSASLLRRMERLAARRVL